MNDGPLLRFSDSVYLSILLGHLIHEETDFLEASEVEVVRGELDRRVSSDKLRISMEGRMGVDELLVACDRAGEGGSRRDPNDQSS